MAVQQGSAFFHFREITNLFNPVEISTPTVAPTPPVPVDGKSSKLFHVKDLLGSSSSKDSQKSSKTTKKIQRHLQNSRNARVVGQGKTFFLVARDYETEAGYRTCIDVVETATGEASVLYQHTSTINCISASVNSDRTILAFTSMKTDTEGDEGVYESSLVEVKPQGSLYALNVKGKQFQRIQFLDEGSPYSASFLFFLDKEYIELYHICLDRKTVNGERKVRIATQPEPEYVLVKKPLWFEWDPHRSLLYCIMPNRSSSSTGGASDSMFRCISFANPRVPEPLLDCCLPIRMPAPGGSDFVPVSIFETPWSATEQTRTLFHVVSLGESPALCLCQQVIREGVDEVLVTVYILHHKRRLDIVIPTPAGTSPSPRAHFLCLGELLAVYVPGIYLHFVDCGPDHDPYDLLTFSGPELAPPLPSPPATDTTPPCFVPCRIQSRSNDSLVDHTSGGLFELSVDHSALLSLFQPRSARVFAHALHMAISHVRDAELIEKIVLHVCSELSSLVTSNFFEEFLLGTAYEVAATMMTTHKAVLPFLPMSTLLREKPKTNHNHSYSILPGPFTNRTGEIGTKSRMQPHRARTASVQSPLPPPSPQQKSVNKIFFALFAGKNQGSSEGLDAPPTPTETSRRQFADLVSQHVLTAFPACPKGAAIEAANEFSRIALDRVDYLFDLLLQAAKGVAANEHKLFGLLQHLHCALQQLSFPIPAAFPGVFANLGFKCLSKRMFLQYLSRDVFTLSESTLMGIAQSLGGSPEDDELRYHLLSRLTDRDKLLEALKQRPSCMPFLLEHWHSLGTIALPSSDEAMGVLGQLEGSNAPEFAPLAIFLHTMAQSSGASAVDKNFLQEHECAVKMFRNTPLCD